MSKLEHLVEGKELQMAQIHDALAGILEGRSVLDVINDLLEKVDVGKRTKHSVPGTSRLATIEVGKTKIDKRFASKLPPMKVGKTKISKSFY
jgi:hypothetical protein